MTAIQLIDSVAKVGLGAFIAAAALTAIKCVPGWPSQSEASQQSQSPVPPQAETDSSALQKEQSELVRNLVSLWVAQNAILWSRLTVISALQTAVYAGWFALWDRERYFLSAGVAVVGSALAWAVYALIDNDLKWKSNFSEKLKRADARLLPTGVRCVQGWKVMRGIILGFYFSNIVLVTLSLMYWITYACFEFPRERSF